MAFSDSELALVDATVGELCRRISSAQHADQLRYTYEVDGSAVSILEERPPWDGTPGDWTQMGVARFRYFRSRVEWQLYWMRSDLKWHAYDLAAPSSDLSSLVNVVEKDAHCCFFG